MTRRHLDRWPMLRYVPAASIAILVGLLHRSAAIDAWVDDRSLAAEPSWFQMAAPFWHAAVHGSFSIANGLTRLVDPLTSASTAGDMRALAAMLTALGAASLLVVLQRARVPNVIALLLCVATTASVLPVGATASVSAALQLLLGSALILAWSVPSSHTRWRIGLLVAVTALGTLTHASFVAFAAGVWALEWFVAAPGTRIRAGLVGAGTLAGSLLLSSWLLSLPVVVPFAIPIDRPGTMAMAIGLMTGRFAQRLQPSHAFDLLSAMGACLPAPMILTVPLAALAFARRDTRPLALACALATIGLIVFMADTWLPDPRIAGVPARLAVVLLIGLGLSWVATQPGRGAVTLAVLSSALLGLRGFIEPIDWRVPVETAQMQAFVEAAPESIGPAAWAVERVAVGRALLGAHRELGDGRVPARADVVAAVPSDRPSIFIGNAVQGTDARVWRAPFDVAYPSATRFLQSQPERMWMAVAVQGDGADGFCGDLLTRLGLRKEARAAANTALVARVGNQEPRAAMSAADRLDIEYGQMLGDASAQAPARFAVEATPVARILINRQIAARADTGMAIATFDPWTADTESWRVGPCSRPVLPVIRDARLATAYAFEGDTASRVTRIPVLASTPIQVRFDATEVFGDGWHQAEGSGDDAFRWTRALEAHVNVAVTHRQPLRIRMNGVLATAAGVPNGLGLSWNGGVVRSLGPWTADLESEWLVPETLVRRGINIFTIRVGALVSPAATGTSSDTRTLGAVIHRLSFEPVLP